MARRGEILIGRSVIVASGGVELSVARLGRGPRLVALHGGPGLDHRVLLPLARRLAGRFEVWLPDLPGHGGSRTASARQPGLGGTLDRLEAWLGRLSGGFDVLLGHSLGALLARELLRRGRVTPRATVLISPPASGQEEGASALARARELTDHRFEPAPAEGRGDRAREDFVAHVLAETRGEPAPELLHAARYVDASTPWEHRALVAHLRRLLAKEVRPFTPACPVLVLVGEEDRTTPPRQAREVAEATAGATLVVIPGAGHYPFGERPIETARAVLEAL